MNFVRTLVASVLAVALSACGGGTSPSAEAEATTTKTLSVSATTQTAAGIEATRFEEGQAFDVVVSVRETTRTTSQGRTLSEQTIPAANATVAIAATGGTAQPGSALTGPDGSARFRVVAGETAGAFEIELATTATGVQGGVTTRLPYMVERTFEPDARLQLLDAAGNAIGAVRPGQVVFASVELRRARVTSVGQPDRYEPAAGVRVDFSADSGRFDPAYSAATTDASGRASIRFVPPVQSGPIRISATAEIDGGSVGASGVVDVRVPQIYLGTGQPFEPGVLIVDPTEVEAGGRARISAYLQDEDGLSFSQPVSVDFTSACAATSAASITSPVLAAGGQVTTTFVAGPGCLNLDVITAELVVEGIEEPVRAQGVIRIRPPRAEGIAYVEASDESIMLQGMGSATRPERTSVTFRVTNSAGIPVQDAQVDFAIVNQLGGLVLEVPSAQSGVDGTAVARVRAGNVPGAFKVRATVRGTTQTAESATIVVSTGAADQDSLSISFETLNIEGFNFDGAATAVTVRAADRLNNPVADGTAIYFTSEGGQIDPECRTAAGACTVQLRSSAPRPANGRVTVLARTEGTESWVDLNGNGLFDAGEPFSDLSEAFRDDNEDGTRGATELFFDANGNGNFDGPNGRLDGGPCAAGVTCGPAIEARASGTVVFSTSTALVDIAPRSLTVDEITSEALLVYVSDRNGNLPAAGTQIQVTASKGTLEGEAGFTIGNTNARGPIALPFTLRGDGTVGDGFVSVRVTSPTDAVTTASIPVKFETACNGAVLPRPPGCEGGGSATVASITATPATVSIGAGQSRTENVAVRILGQANPPAPIRGVTPTFQCDLRESTGISVRVPDAIGSTNDTGLVTLQVEIESSTNAEGTAVCAISAGGVTTNFEVVGPPRGAGTAGSITVSPATISVPANSTREARVLVTVLNAGAPAAPLAGIAPALRCTGASASDISVVSSTIAPTSAAGQTEIPLTITTGSAPTGSYACEVTSGAARATFVIQP